MQRPRIIFTPHTIASGLFKLSLVAAVLIFLSPPLRRWATPAVEPLINPVRRITVADRVNELSRQVEKEIHITGEAPQSRDLAAIIQRMHPGRKNAGLDPWGRRYFLRRRAGAFQVASSGPDRRRGTRDDILSRPRSVTGRPAHPLPEN